MVGRSRMRAPGWALGMAMVVLVGAIPASALAASPGTGAGSGSLSDCVRTADTAEHSVARIWDEAILDAIRRDLPRPTVHARNLFHMSAGMWDAWAAYDPVASGYFVDEHQTADDIRAAREEAISYAAYRILSERYGTENAVGSEEDITQFDETLA